MSNELITKCLSCLMKVGMKPKRGAKKYTGPCTECNSNNVIVYDMREIVPLRDGGMVASVILFICAGISAALFILALSSCQTIDKAEREWERFKNRNTAPVEQPADPAPEVVVVPEPEPEPLPPVSIVYPWTGKQMINSTEGSRHSDSAYLVREAYMLDFARINGGRCEYGPIPTWPDKGHMTSRAVLVWRRGSQWYYSDFAGWADVAGHGVPGGAWCATNEFETWSSGSNPLQADELWFAVAPREGGQRSSYIQIK